MASGVKWSMPIAEKVLRVTITALRTRCATCWRASSHAEYPERRRISRRWRGSTHVTTRLQGECVACGIGPR